MAETKVSEVSVESGETNITLLDESKTKMDAKMDRKASAKRCQRWQQCSWCLVWTTVALSLVFLSTTIGWHVVRHGHLAPRERHICVPCTDLTNTTGDEVITRRYDAGKKQETCCADTSVILSNMVKKYTEIKYNEDASPAYSKCDMGREKAAARLTGVMVTNMQQSGQNSTQTDVLQWNSSSHMSFMKQGVSYSNGYMTVTEDGYYYVFSQVKYTDVMTDPGHGINFNDAATLDSHSDSNLKHFLYHYSPSHGTERKLIESSRSQCQIYSKPGNSTNFMGAVFRLGASDKVYVKISHPHMITACEHGNFFGLYQV